MLRADEDLTSGGMVCKFSLSFEGHLDREGSRFCNIYDLEVVIAVQETFDQRTGALTVNREIYSELGPMQDWGKIRFRI